MDEFNAAIFGVISYRDWPNPACRYRVLDIEHPAGYDALISYQGIYQYRIGSTKNEFK